MPSTRRECNEARHSSFLRREWQCVNIWGGRKMENEKSVDSGVCDVRNI